MIKLYFERILLIEFKHSVIKSKRSMTGSVVSLAFFNSQGALPCLLWDPVCKTPDWETQVIHCSCLYWFWIHCFETNILLEIALSQTFTWSGSWGQRQSRLGRASREEKRLSALRFPTHPPFPHPKEEGKKSICWLAGGAMCMLIKCHFMYKPSCICC